MSLNGLDTPEVLEAHQTAIAEAAGWFLLKYTSRDAVELLGRGKGGVHEARLAIAKYSDPSPLYGILIYRRRKVLIKYIPVGTSRVVQARTAVHFQDVAERYAPYETLLEITTADGLNDTSLAASFPLHTASLSATSSRLHEISEDAEDSGGAPRRPTLQQQDSASIFGTRQYKIEKRVDQIMRNDRAPPSIHVSTDAPSTASSTLSPGKSISSQILVREDSGKRSITSLSSPLSESMTSFSSRSEASPVKENERSSTISETPKTRSLAPLQPPATQASSTTASAVEPLLEESSLVDKQRSPPASQGSEMSSPSKPSYDEPFDFSYLEPKTKIRLAPRPVANKRATTTGVSALPAHYRPQPRKPDLASPTSPLSLPAIQALPMPPIPKTAEYNPRPISRGSVKSLPSHKSTTMTPDKLRLMKAVELRKRQLRKSNPQLPSAIPGVALDAPQVPRVPDQLPEQQQQRQEAKDVRLEELQNAQRQEDPANKADSGIELDYQKTASRSDDAEPGATDPKHSQGPAVEETLVNNDEAKAEAEGYGAVPDELREDAQPKLPSYGTPEKSTAQVDDTPSTVYSDTRDYPEPVMNAAQTATLALNDAALAGLAQDSSEVPTITMSPDSPMQAQHPAAVTEVVTPKAVSEVSNDESNDHLNVQSSPRRSDLAKRRRGIVEPLNLEAEAELLSDDDLMDELQSAVVSHATPMAVAKSPVNEFFPRRPSNISLVSAQSRQSQQNAAPDNPVETQDKEDNLAEPVSTARRSISPMSSMDTFTGLRRNVSSGITKRFQALTEGGREGPGTPSTVSPAQSQDGNPYDRRPRGAGPRPGSFNRRWGLGDRASSGSTITNNTENTATWSVSQDSNGNRDSIHVRARIVRPASALNTHPESPGIDNNTEPQLEEHQTVMGTLPPLDTAAATSESYTVASPTTRSRNHSLTPVTAQPEDFPTPPVGRNVASLPSDKTRSPTSSRTSRFFKRMSNLGGAKRRSPATQSGISMQATATADSNTSGRSTRTMSTYADKDRSDMPPPAALGDLNIQFPDTLLWKRRWLSLDDAGNLVIGHAQSMDRQKTAQAKKFNLAEFKLPFIPDLDRQEMPYSICLDFNEGGTLQIACEDGMGQRHVLNMLRNYWKSWVG